MLNALPLDLELHPDRRFWKSESVLDRLTPHNLLVVSYAAPEGAASTGSVPAEELQFTEHWDVALWILEPGENVPLPD